MACTEPGWCDDVGMVLAGRTWEIYSGQFVTTPRMDEYQRQLHVERWRLQHRGEKPSTIAGTRRTPRRMGLGDMVEASLSAVGVTKERVEKWVGAPCGCEERQTKLNALGAWAAQAASAAPALARRWLGKILGEEGEHVAEEAPGSRGGGERLAGTPELAQQRSEIAGVRVQDFGTLETWAGNLETLATATDWRGDHRDIDRRGSTGSVQQGNEGIGAVDVRWSYGLTSCHSRLDTTLRPTLESLAAAGFAEPRLFLDGVSEKPPWLTEMRLEATCRMPAIRTHGNWILGLYELYIRDPAADLYAMFQDDIEALPHLRDYLDTLHRKRRLPEKAYFNLFAFSSNEGKVKGQRGFVEAADLGPKCRHIDGKPMQTGRGALALVLPRAAVVELLMSRHMTMRPMDPNRGWKVVDGGIVESLNEAGWREYVHAPSLIQHRQGVSSIGNPPHPKALTYPGPDFDCLRLLECS